MPQNDIAFLFPKFGNKGEEEWEHGFGVIKTIMAKLEIPSNSKTSVVSILKDALVARAADRLYDPKSAQQEQGAAGTSGTWHIASHHGIDNDEPEGEEGKDGDGAVLALDPDSNEDIVQGGEDDDNDGGDF